MATFWKFLVAVILTTLVVDATLPPPDQTYKVLMLLPFGSKSHRNVFIPIAEGLANRGHKVVIVSSLPPTTQNHNIHEIHTGLNLLDIEGSNMFEVRKNDSSGGFQLFKELLPKIAREMYLKPHIKELYEKRDEFDVIMVDGLFNEPAYPFTYEKPFIMVSPPGKLPTVSAVQGNVFNPSYMPSFSDFPRPYSFISRIKNTFSFIGFTYLWKNQVLPLIQAEITPQFPALPSLGELEKNVSLVLMNTHFSLSIPSPNLPSQIEVGGMHCRPGKSLTPDLEKWINGADEGVIYFSLGSVTKGSFMPDEYKNIFIKAFARIKQRVIWKFEAEIDGLSSNVFRKGWLPQQDILAKSNVKAFITHGGALSMQESIYHSTPLIAIPIFGDQPANGQWIYNNEYGYNLVWEQLTEDMIVNAIEDIVNNPKYSKNVAAASSTFRDQPMNPKELAVWWTEYVMRHKGAPGLRCPAVDISWIEYFMLDVLLFLHLIIFMIYKITKKLICLLISKKPVKKQKMN